MYTEYKKSIDNHNFSLIVNYCYTLKCDLRCTHGVFSKGTIVRVKDIFTEFSDYLYTFESDGVTDTYCLESDKTLESIFQYNKEYADRCNEIEKTYDKLKDNFEDSITWLCSILVILSITAITYGLMFYTFISAIIGGCAFFVAVTIPFVSPNKENERIDKITQSKISEILKVN